MDSVRLIAARFLGWEFAFLLCQKGTRFLRCGHYDRSDVNRTPDKHYHNVTSKPLSIFNFLYKTCLWIMKWAFCRLAMHVTKKQIQSKILHTRTAFLYKESSIYDIQPATIPSHDAKWMVITTSHWNSGTPTTSWSHLGMLGNPLALTTSCQAPLNHHLQTFLRTEKSRWAGSLYKTIYMATHSVILSTIQK